MNEQLASQLREVKPPLDTARTLPPALYSDQELFRLERKLIFHQSWIGVGRSDRWKTNGDYTALDIAGVPIIILRDGAGELRAYANSCRHRGAKLLFDDGNCKTIRCPFHRWTYALDGRLLTAPQIEQSDEFQYADYGLISITVDTFAGFAFVSFDSEIGPIEQWLGDFANFHSPWPLGELVSTRRRELEVECNWKCFMEVFNEYYHLPYVHPDSINAIYAKPDDADEVQGNYATQFGITEGTGGLLTHQQGRVLPKMRKLAGRNASGTRYTWIYPNMTFAASTESIWVYETYPMTPNRTKVGMTVCFPPETIAGDNFDEDVKEYYYRMDAALEEDIPFLVNQQAGLASSYAKQGRFSPLEPSVANFACWYADKMLENIG